MLQLPLNVQLDDSATFDNFYTVNEQLCFRLKNLVNEQEQGDFIYVWGAEQTGKTHLAQAVCHYFDENNQSAVYLPLSNSQLSPDVLNGMDCMDLVCLDDLEAVLSDSYWQHAIFNLYNNLKLNNKKLLILTSGAPTHCLIELADLQSRLCAMEIYKLESLSDLQKQDFLQQRANNRGFEISNEIARFILSRKGRSIADLVDVLDKIDESSIALKRKVTIPLIKEIFDI